MKPITADVSNTYQALKGQLGESAAIAIYELIKAVIVEQSLPDEEHPPEVWTEQPRG
jgi:hypothetical protein